MPAPQRTILAGIVVLGALLRFATLDAQSYWFDEATTVQLLRMDLFDMVAAIPDSESTPPLYYVIAWFWTKLFGTGEVGLRSLSALAGTATIPVVYAIGARTVGPRVGLVAAGLAAANPLLVWYSQEARAYALLVLLTALTLVVLPRALERPTAGRLAGWAALSALAIATHYFAAFLVVPEAVWLFYRWRARTFVPIAVVGLTGMAVLPIALAQASNDGARFIRGESMLSRLPAIPKQFLVGYSAPGEAIAIAVAGLAGLFGLYLLWRSPDRDRVVPLAVLTAAVVAVPAVLAIVDVDYLITRNVIVALVPALVVLATGYASTRAGLVAAAALAVVGVAMCVAVAVDKKAQRDDWRGAIERLGPPRAQRMLVVSPVNGRIPVEVYLDGARKAPAEGGVPVTEIDVVGFAPRGPGDPSDPPRPASAPPPPGFTIARRIEDETFTLVTYRAAQPVASPDAALYSLALGGAEAELVLDAPP